MSDVLPFPQTAEALRHYRTDMQAAGYLSLLLMDRSEEAIPANVQRFDEPEGMTLPARTPAFILLMLIYDGLPKRQRDRIKRLVRGMAYSDRPLPEAVQLHNALRVAALGRAPC
jgi:hypothetical protein